jgi:hypothetical protein
MATTPYPFVSGATLTAAQLNSTFNIPVSAKTASYVLVAADAGTRITMTSASATTITVNTSIFSAGDSLEIVNLSTGVCTVTAGTCTVSTTGTLAMAQNASGKLVFISASAAIYIAGDVAGAASTFAIFNETQASGTAGGASVQTTYTKRTFNTTVVNNIGATLTSSVIALVAGTYRVFAISPHFNSNVVALRLRNTTDSTTTVSGPNNYSLSASGCYTELDGFFTITGTKNFEVQYYQAGAAVATNGLGVQLSSPGVSEIYGQITIEKIG